MTGSAQTYIFAGGGTGGHLAPAVAVAEELLATQSQAKALFVCTDRPIDGRFLHSTGFGMIVQPVRPIPRNPLGWPGFYLRWRRSLALAGAILRDVRPAAVLGLGGFAAGPMARRAAGRGVRTALLNPDAIPGKANRYLAQRADAIFTQFEETADCFPPSVRHKVRLVGCPVRRSLLAGDRRQARSALGLRQDLRTLAVMGGSLGAETINRAVLAMVDALASRAQAWQVLHITGAGKAESVERAYRDCGLTAVVMEFCECMGLIYAAADLVIGRAGANTIAELTATGTAAVLVPYPFHRDRHQHHNAAPMVAAGAAVLVEDAMDLAENARRLQGALVGLLDDPSRLTGMARSARSLARPAAAAEVARWLIGEG